MSIEHLEPGEQHRRLVEELNKLFNYNFKKRKGHVYSNEVHEKLEHGEVTNMAAITSRVFNMSGGSIGDIDLYRLFQAYFLDVDKRAEINEILK